MERLGSILSVWDKLNHFLGLWFERVAILGLMIMIFGTTFDVIGSKFFRAIADVLGLALGAPLNIFGEKIFKWPLPAGTEIVYFGQVIAIAGALAISKLDGRHIRIEFVDKLPKYPKAVVNFLSTLLGLALFTILAWKSYEYALNLIINNEVTATARILIYPFVLWLALCCIPVCLILLKELISSVVEATKK
jgi:TRAP-type C4-dicarboxylate transport system permease small subunit